MRKRGVSIACRRYWQGGALTWESCTDFRQSNGLVQFEIKFWHTMTFFDNRTSISSRVFSCVLQILIVSVKFGNVKWYDSEQFEFGQFGQCSNMHQRTAFDVHSRHRCNTREEVVELELPPDGGVIQLCHLRMSGYKWCMIVFHRWYPHKSAWRGAPDHAWTTPAIHAHHWTTEWWVC